MCRTKLPCVEYVYRDHLSLKLGGKTEVSAGDRRIDVLTSDSVIEVKYARSESVADIKSTLDLYWHRIEKRDPKPFPRSRHIYFIWSRDRLARNKEKRRAEREFQELDMKPKEYILSGIVERDICPEYCIGGLHFKTQAEIESYCRQIKRDFLVADYLSRSHQQFLRDLVDAYRWVNFGKHCDEVNVDSTFLHGEGMFVSVRDQHIPLSDCVSAYRALTHYRLLSMPVEVDR